MGDGFDLTSEQGTAQGDPLAPLFFCLAAKPLGDLITSFGPDLNTWYLDNGMIAGDVRVLGAIMEVIVSEGAKIGLHVNLSKCHLWTPVALVDPLPASLSSGVQLDSPSDGIRVSVVLWGLLSGLGRG